MHFADLQTIIAKLRDKTDDKEIAGVTIDRATLSRIMTGVVGVLSILLKSTIDSIVAAYMEGVGDQARADLLGNETCLPFAAFRGKQVCDGQ